MTNLNRSDDNDLLVALSHPVRRDSLRALQVLGLDEKRHGLAGESPAGPGT